MRTPKELVEKAEAMNTGIRLPGFIDNKTYCGIEDIIVLLEDDATINKLNCRDSAESNYIHEVNYKGYTFQAVSNKKIEKELKQ